jgi:hypothetical protein
LAPSAVSIAAKKKKKKAAGRNSGTWLVGALKWYFNMDGKLWGIDHACFFLRGIDACFLVLEMLRICHWCEYL